MLFRKALPLLYRVLSINQGGDLYVAQHIIDDAAPGARHIRGYRIARSDWALYPEPVRGKGGCLEEVEPFTKRLPAPEA